MNETIQILHHDLGRRFKQHGTRVEQIWRSLGKEEREKTLRAGSQDQSVLEDPHDTSLGNISSLIPEWNIQDLTPSSSEILLEILRYRATTSLSRQYICGINEGPGDHEHILGAIQSSGLQLANASKYRNCYTMFLEDEHYGQSYEVTPSNKDQFLIDMKLAIEARLMISQDVGELVLMRQYYLLQLLNIFVEDVLETASSERSKITRPTRLIDVGIEAMAKLSFHSTVKQLEMPDLIESSQEQKSAREDYVDLISTEPTVLQHEVNLWFFTRPELVADEKGRSMPVHTDKYISGAVLDAVHGAVKAATIWSYISQLLALLDSSPDRRFRTMVRQELSNTCHLELLRTQRLFTRCVWAHSGRNKWFERKSTVRKDGIVRIAMKRNPETLILANPQLYYMLRLCQDSLTWSDAVQWLQKLEDLHRAHPLEKNKMAEKESSLLGDLAIIVTFLQSLGQVEHLPVATRKHTFSLKVLVLDTTMEKLKEGLDVGDFAIPMSNLLEPGMASGALVSLHRHIEEKTGKDICFLYEQLVNDCVADLHKRYHELRAEASKPDVGSVLATVPEVRKPTSLQQREKGKTRPLHSSPCAIDPEADGATSQKVQPEPSRPVFKVKSATFHVFSLLFSRSSAARGSIGWDAFVAAMTDVGFSVIPKFGSVYTFVPPEKTFSQRRCTLHRPHKSCIEGVVLLVYSRRLKRLYEWDDSTFILV